MIQNSISNNEKNFLMQDIIFMLHIIEATKQYGIGDNVIKQVEDYNNEFFTMCYSLMGSGFPVDLIERFSNYCIDSESDPLSKLRMRIQAETIINMHQSSLCFTAMILLSLLGLKYKKYFTEYIKNTDKHLYDLIFKNEEFYLLDIKGATFPTF